MNPIRFNQVYNKPVLNLVNAAGELGPLCKLHIDMENAANCMLELVQPQKPDDPTNERWCERSFVKTVPAL